MFKIIAKDTFSDTLLAIRDVPIENINIKLFVTHIILFSPYICKLSNISIFQFGFLIFEKDIENRLKPTNQKVQQSPHL